MVSVTPDIEKADWTTVEFVEELELTSVVVPAADVGVTTRVEFVLLLEAVEL